MLNNWRMAQLHAQEAPERVLELEDWGALFDRTDDGLISQRDFGGHRYARLAHVGDRTGLEMIRTLQQRAVALGIDVFMECTVTELCSRTVRRRRSPAPSATGARPAASSSSRRRRSCWRPAASASRFKVTSNSWEYTGDGHALALRAGAPLINMEFVQFHPTGMVWPPSVKGLLVTESVRGDGGILKNSEGKRFMFDYIPEFFKAETADTEEEADRWYDDKKNNRRPPELLPRDEVARAINSEIKAGRGITARRRLPRHRLAPHAGVHPQAAAVDVPPVQGAGRRRHHRRADGDRPDLPLRDGRRRGRRRHRAERASTGLYAVGECSGGMHGSNRLGGNSLSDLLVFGRRAGERRGVLRRRGCGGARPDGVGRGREGGRRQPALAPFERRGRQREPVHDPAGPPADDERPGRHHPHRATSSSSRWSEIEKLKERAPAPRRSRATGSTTPAGTWRSTCATCCSSPSASRRRRWSARSRAAATPATTSRARRRSGAA